MVGWVGGRVGVRRCVGHTAFMFTEDAHDQVMVAAGGPEAVRAALERHPVQNHAALHKYARWCLERLQGITPGTRAALAGG